MRFALISDRIQVGDVVLVSRAAFAPFFIRLFTLSKCSHVAMCTRPGMLLEAVPDGVIWQSVFETYADKRRWLRVLRPKRPLVANAFGLSVEHYAEQKYEFEYSKIGALATLVPGWTFDDPGAVFCSRLVAEAYADYGLDLFPGKNPRKVRPGTFMRSPELYEVTKKCVRELDPVSDSDRFALIRATSEVAIAEQLMAISRRSLNEIRRRLAARLPPDIYSLPVLRWWLSLNSPAAQIADAEIMNVLKEQGYVDAMSQWSAKVDAETTRLEEDIATIVQQPKASAAEIDWAVSILSEGLLVAETTMTSRRLTKEEHEVMAQKAPLATLVYFRDLYRLHYDIFFRRHQTYLRFLSAIKSLSNAESETSRDE